MRRLVYAPKAYAYVRTEHDGIVELTPYITSGSVVRMVNAPSTAEITFRNPGMMFTNRSRTSKGPFFKPMDPISIWLERIRGFPVQVFTGYIDTAPYLQLYPGPATITASCTLKRLNHIYWDMGLNYVNNWLAKYGWQGDRNTGSVRNPNAEKDSLKETHTQLTDGSIGELLFATLTDVADWPESRIHIEQLPEDLAGQVANIWKAYSEDAELVGKDIERMIKRYIGEGNYATGGLGSGGSGGGGGSTPIDIEAVEKFNKIYPAHFIENAAGHAFLSFDEWRAIYEALGESVGRAWTYATIAKGEGGGGKEGAYPGIVQHDPGDGNVGYGGVQLTPHAWGSSGAIIDYMNSLGGIPGLRNPIITGKVSIKLNDLSGGNFEPWGGGGNSAANRSRYLDESPPANLTPALNRIRPQTKTAAAPDKTTTGGKLKNNSDSGVKGQSKWTYPLAIKGTFMGGVAAHMARAFGNWMSDNAVDIGVPPRTQAIAVEDGVIERLSGSPITDGGAGNPNGLTVYLTGKSGLHYCYMHFYETKVVAGQKVTAGDVVGLTGTANGVDHLHFACQEENPETVIGEGNITDAPGDAGGGDGSAGSQTGANWEDVLSTAKAAAFVQEFQFPGLMESFESMALTGPKALMNDKPLFPFVDQMSKAAMRSFQSLPNGDFYAFYPDYFGTIGDRKPYWEIDDIEILDGQIMLSDEALATHVFTAGDTMPFTPGVDAFERMTSTGVVNIFNKAQSGFVAGSSDPKQIKAEERVREQHRKTIVSDPEGCMRFLQKYGARPHLEEAPFVRSRFYEAFLAWTLFDLMWSRQFITDFTFTFMPEVFPGGLIAFPDHGVQCYVDQVEHSWDYESGFTTTASLSAPATLTDEKLSDDPLSHGLVRAGAAK